MKSVHTLYGCLLFVLLLLSISCGSRRAAETAKTPRSPVVPVPESPYGPGEHRTSLADFPPYFDRIRGGEAALALRENRLEEAIALFDEIHSTTSDIIITPRARFVAAYLAEALGDDERALKELPPLAVALPQLADLAHERAARAAIRLGKGDRAIALLERIDGSSTLAPEAALLRADALRIQGKAREAAAAYQQYLDRFPRGRDRQEAGSRFVSCTVESLPAAESTEAAAREALDMLNHLKAQHPTGYWTRQAEAHEDAIFEALGQKPVEYSPDRKAAIKAYEKALELKNKLDHKAAENAYDRVLRLARIDSELNCRAQFERAVVVANQREYERAGALFERTVEVCDDPNYRIRALYRGAKAYQSADHLRDAIRMFNRVETEFSTHSYADDARLRGAKCYLDLGLRDTFAEMLSSLPELYPSGDMRAEALWTLAHDAIEHGEWDEARGTLLRYHELFPNETGWYAAGRSAYWLGRVEELIGDVDKAKERYEHVIATTPLSYYMVLAYNRLTAIARTEAEALLASLAPKGGDGALRFDRSLLREFPKLATGIELTMLGLLGPAKRELDALLKTVDLPPEVHWVVAQLQESAGDFATSRETASKTDTAWMKRYPSGENQTPWTIAYPTAFEDEVTKAAEENSIPAPLIWAVMREESGFNPRIESWANAIGLMQLILPTARSMGKARGIQVNRRTLRKPDVNISLGTAYLSYLEELFGNNPVLIVAGYNAGEGAVARWLKENGSEQIDLFIERIPYDQTRGYTKRVLSTYATYHFLYGDKREILPLPMTLPASSEEDASR